MIIDMFAHDSFCSYRRSANLNLRKDDYRSSTFSDFSPPNELRRPSNIKIDADLVKCPAILTSFRNFAGKDPFCAAKPGNLSYGGHPPRPPTLRRVGTDVMSRFLIRTDVIRRRPLGVIADVDFQHRQRSTGIHKRPNASNFGKLQPKNCHRGSPIVRLGWERSGGMQRLWARLKRA